jgi:RNA polymerase I-specific transcription initiation factor RRN7
LSGRSGVDLYLKCLQLILRHQIWYLIKDKGLPTELETVVFDLWSLRIAQLGDKIASDSQGFDSQSQSQAFSTLDSDESGTETEKSTARSNRKIRTKLGGLPSLLDCLALCYLGILTLRLPVTPGDIFTWTTDGKLAYQRAIKYLPLTMKDRLPSTYHAALDPDTLLKYSRFYTATTDLQMSFMEQHKIVWPPLNHPLLLFRYLKELGLPVELYDATIRLAGLLGYNFTLHQADNRRFGIRHLPEAQLVGCLVVCVKLFYPFDNKQRHPKLPSEPTAVVLDWGDWARQVKAAKDRQRGETDRFTGEELVSLQDKDIFSMQPGQLDQYLDFYADTFLDNAEIQRTRENDDFRNALYQMFPTEGEQDSSQLPHGLPSEDGLKMVQSVHSNMRAMTTVDDAEAGMDTVRPGQLYPLYKNEQDLPAQARQFYEEVARLAGLSMEMLIMAVFATEGRVEKWRRKQRKEGGD